MKGKQRRWRHLEDKKNTKNWERNEVNAGNLRKGTEIEPLKYLKVLAGKIKCKRY